MSDEQKYLDLIGKVIYLPKKFIDRSSHCGFYVIVGIDIENLSGPLVVLDRDFITIYGAPGSWNSFSVNYILQWPHNKGVVVL